MEVIGKSTGRTVSLPLLASMLLIAGLLKADSTSQAIVKEFGITKKKGEETLLLTINYSEIFDEKSKKKLSSGLPTVVLMRLFLYREGEKKPIRMALRKCKVIFDIWEEQYIVTISVAGKNRTKKLSSVDETVALCSSVKDFPFAVDNLHKGTYRFAAAIDLNPLSREVVEAMRSWLKRPLGDRGQLNLADSFFGSFITLFVNEKIEPAEKTIKLLSQKFKLPLQ